MTTVTDNDTRLFFVVDSIEDNEEIFETLESAEMFYDQIPAEYKPRIRICLVRHAYQEPDMAGDSWNYDDLSNTFEEVKRLK
jgi:hypothetical protein